MKFKPRLVFGTSAALIAFAANSILCRAALGSGVIDATGFTVIRLFSGAAVLCLLVAVKTLRDKEMFDHLLSRGSWHSAFMLFIYAAGFSFAYLSLDSGVGALVLFGTVQLTLLSIHRLNGGHLLKMQIVGILLAFAGLLVLLLPEKNHWYVSPRGFAIMALSGVGWGVYTYNGKRSSAPLADTALNFLKSMVFVVFLLPFFWISETRISAVGILLAISSGAVTSGLGYALWYAVLPGLSTVQASTLQLLVPVLATLGGFVLLGETLTLRFGISTVMVLAGISFASNIR